MKRLLIFQMNNENGIVEDYVSYLLSQLSTIAEKIVVIVNGKLKDSQKGKILEFANDVFFRENKGYDAEAYREVILSIIGIKRIRMFDELILCNDTFFGFFHSVYKIFSDMEKRDVDFWGLTKHAEYNRVDWSMPEHIQSFFLVIKKRMLVSVDFEKFWLTMPEISSFDFLVKNFENRFTVYFHSKGFLYSAYVDDDDLNGDSLYNYNHYSIIPYTLLSAYNMPVLKRKNFSEGKNLNLSFGDELVKSMKWIEEHTDYDLGMIWDSVIRKFSPVDLKDTLNLNYIISGDDEIINHCDSEIVVYLTCFERIDITYSYLKKIPVSVRVIIITNRIEIKNFCSGLSRNNITCVYKDNIGYDEALLVGCKMIEGKYICFLHDLFLCARVDDYEKNRSVNTMIWENAGLGKLMQVERLFEKNPFLGILAMPEPIHAYFINDAKVNWHMVFDDLMKLVKILGLKCRMEILKPLFTYCGAFWFRKSIGEKLITFDKIIVENIMSEGVLKYLLVCIAQDSAKFSGAIFAQDMANVHIQNMTILLRETMRKKNLIDYINRFEKIYVYGAGKWAREVYYTIKSYNYDVKSFVVSDEHIGDVHFLDREIVSVKDLCLDNMSCLVVAVGRKNMREIEEVISKYEFRNVYYYMWM